MAGKVVAPEAELDGQEGVGLALYVEHRYRHRGVLDQHNLKGLYTCKVNFIISFTCIVDLESLIYF